MLFLLVLVCTFCLAAIVVTVSPASVTLYSGDTQQFAFAITGTKVNLAVVWSCSAGKISASGLFTAPVVTSSTTVTIRATRVLHGSQYGTATVTVLPSGPPPPRSVDLTWNAVSGAVGYSVYRKAAGGSYALLASAISGTAYSDAGVLAGQTYYYVATATDATGVESGYSNEAEAVIPTP